MRIILLIVSFLIIIFTFIIFYIGIYDEIYQELEKNKLWHSDGSFGKSLIFLLVSFFCSIYVFKYYANKKNKDETYNSVEAYKSELVKHDKYYKEH